MSACCQAKRVRKRLAKTRPPKGKSKSAQAKSEATKARMSKKK